MVEKAKKQGSFVSPPVATISESSGIPKRKYFPPACETELRPLFTGQVFIVAKGLLAGDSRGATGVGAGMSARRWPPAPITGMVPPIPPLRPSSIIP
jgi:hypothetical protein